MDIPKSDQANHSSPSSTSEPDLQLVLKIYFPIRQYARFVYATQQEARPDGLVLPRRPFKGENHTPRLTTWGRGLFSSRSEEYGIRSIRIFAGSIFSMPRSCSSTQRVRNGSRECFTGMFPAIATGGPVSHQPFSKSACLYWSRTSD
jgi:hypothetical protein